jgi:hypothetical protein
VTRRDDGHDEMVSDLDAHAVIEALLQGRAIDDHGPFALFVDDVHVATERPATRPSDELAALLTAGLPPTPAAAGLTEPAPRTLRRRRAPRARSGSRWSAPAARVAELGLATKAALGIALVGTAAVGAAAAGVLPQQTVDAVRHVIAVITPFDVEDSDARLPDPDAGMGPNGAAQAGSNEAGLPAAESATVGTAHPQQPSLSALVDERAGPAARPSTGEPELGPAPDAKATSAPKGGQPSGPAEGRAPRSHPSRPDQTLGAPPSDPPLPAPRDRGDVGGASGHHAANPDPPRGPGGPSADPDGKPAGLPANPGGDPPGPAGVGAGPGGPPANPGGDLPDPSGPADGRDVQERGAG